MGEVVHPLTHGFGTAWVDHVGDSEDPGQRAAQVVGEGAQHPHSGVVGRQESAVGLCEGVVVGAERVGLHLHAQELEAERLLFEADALVVLVQRLFDLSGVAEVPHGGAQVALAFAEGRQRVVQVDHLGAGALRFRDGQDLLVSGAGEGQCFAAAVDQSCRCQGPDGATADGEVGASPIAVEDAEGQLGRRAGVIAAGKGPGIDRVEPCPQVWTGPGREAGPNHVRRAPGVVEPAELLVAARGVDLDQREQLGVEFIRRRLQGVEGSGGFVEAALGAQDRGDVHARPYAIATADSVESIDLRQVAAGLVSVTRLGFDVGDGQQGTRVGFDVVAVIRARSGAQRVVERTLEISEFAQGLGRRGVYEGLHDLAIGAVALLGERREQLSALCHGSGRVCGRIEGRDPDAEPLQGHGLVHGRILAARPASGIRVQTRAGVAGLSWGSVAPMLPFFVELSLLACTTGSAPPIDHAPVATDGAANPALVAQAHLFDQELLTPVEGVHVAVGFALANVIALEGPEGLVIVDSTEGRPSAEEALAAIRGVTDKPIAALVLTHNHADHVFGGQVFVEEAARQGHPDIPVWAHASLQVQLDRVVNVLRDALQVRSMRMFGTFLEPIGTGAGIGMRLRFRPQDIALARPDHTFDDVADIDAGGLKLRLIHVPGETDDQIAVWWPARRVLLPADDIYQAFPNLYTIRGTPYRDVRAWVASLDRMRDLHAEVLVPQHTRPLVGAAAVEDTLTAYRDAIQYVHDQTVRGLNSGRTADELAATVRLPPHLASHPWLAEHYGSVSWSVRSICDGYLGWFDGHAAHLDPLPPDERGRRMMAAFAAGTGLPDQAQAALAAGDLQWAAELGQLWVDADPNSPEAHALLADALDGLGRGHINANARNWYLSEAGELRGELTIEPTATDLAPVGLVDSLPIDPFMQALATRLRAEDVLDVDWRAVFEFADLDRVYLVHVRRGVAEVRLRSTEQLASVRPDLTIQTTARTWKRIASKHESALAAAARGDLTVDGDLSEVVKLLRWFERG